MFACPISLKKTEPVINQYSQNPKFVKHQSFISGITTIKSQLNEKRSEKHKQEIFPG